MDEKKEPLYSATTIILIVITVLSFLGFGFIIPLRALYARQIGASSLEVGIMASSALLTGMVAMPIVGSLVDRLGPRKILLIALFLHSLIVLAYVPVQSTLLLILLRGLEGITAAGVFPPARALMNLVAPPHRQGEALGVLSSARSAGILLGPGLGSFLAGFAGYALSFVIAAITLFLGAFVVLVFVAKSSDTRSAWTQTKGEKNAFSPGLTLPYGLGGLLGIPMGIADAVWSLYMQDRGASLFLIGLSYTTFALPGLMISPFIGRQSDQHGRYWFIVTGLLLAAVIYSSYALPIPPIWIVILSVVEGLAATVVRSTTDGLLADFLPKGLEGRVQGNYSMISTAGNFIGSVLGGYLYDFQPGIPFLAEGVLLLFIGAILFFPTIRSLFPEFGGRGVLTIRKG